MINKNIIKKLMSVYRFNNLKAYKDNNLDGYFSKNIQIVYIREIMYENIPLIEHIYLCVDILKESLIVGYVLKNYKIKDGTYKSTSVTVPLINYTYKNLEKALHKLGIKK